MWLPGGSWNLGGFERALDDMTVRLSGTNSDCLFRAGRAAILDSLTRLRAPKPLRRQGAPLVTSPGICGR
jgi:hypothetical protein